MTAETLTQPNGVVENGNLHINPNPNVSKKSKESERRRRRRKQKKNKASQVPSDATADEESDDDSKENNDPKQVMEQVEIEYVPEKAELEDGIDEEFRKIFEKFCFQDSAGAVEDKKDEAPENATSKKKADSDSEDEEQDNQQKEKGVSNKKKKLQRRMKIAELKQVSSRPDVVEVWDATAADPKLLVFLKS